MGAIGNNININGNTLESRRRFLFDQQHGCPTTIDSFIAGKFDNNTQTYLTRAGRSQP